MQPQGRVHAVFHKQLGEVRPAPPGRAQYLCHQRLIQHDCLLLSVTVTIPARPARARQKPAGQARWLSGVPTTSPATFPAARA